MLHALRLVNSHVRAENEVKLSSEVSRGTEKGIETADIADATTGMNFGSNRRAGSEV